MLSEREPIELYEPYNPKYCKVVDCKYRHGNKCIVSKCVRNHKCILCWEQIGELHPQDKVN